MSERGRVSPLRAAARRARRILEPWLAPQVSYAQEGEDRILARLLEATPGPGFYIDVGAHHPCRFSNTYLFYRRGWRGINVEAAPGSMGLFRRLRPRDINLECAVAEEPGMRTLYVFDDAALNTMDASLLPGRRAAGHSPLRELPVTTRRLDAILDEHLPRGIPITFLTVDVEGLDLQVLRSNDWSRYRPLYVLSECIDLDLRDLDRHPIAAFMAAQGYRPVARTMNTLFLAGC